MDSPAPDKLVHLDDEGDLVVVVRDAQAKSHSFLVSSEKLSLASTVFVTMVDRNLKEGHPLQENKQAPSAQPPTITLDNDDIAAMDFILRDLHLESDRVRNGKDFNASAIANIAVHSDKYRCNTALEPWIRLWCHPDRFPAPGHGESVEDIETTNRDMSYGLLAAWLFQSPQLGDMSDKYVKDFTWNFAFSWEKDKLLSRLPKAIAGELCSQIGHTLHKMRDRVLETLSEFHRVVYTCADPAVPGQAAAQYIAALTDLKLWPFMDKEDIKAIPVNGVCSLLATLSQPESCRTAHGCSRPELQDPEPDAWDDCGFWREIHRMFVDIVAIHDKMPGLSLWLANHGDKGHDGNDEEDEAEEDEEDDESDDDGDDGEGEEDEDDGDNED